MANNEEAGSPLHVEPILAVNDVTQTVQYWHDVLGFPHKWTWGEPPNHGGVAWHATFIQFSQNAGLASASKGNTIFIKVKKLEAMYHFHQQKNAVIVEPLENKPWGGAGYTVKEINGYYIFFGGALIPERKNSPAELPATIRMVKRIPSVKEYQALASSVGWSLYTNDMVVENLLKAPVFSVVAEDTLTDKAIGCAFLLGDHASFYYVKDVIVHPGWQSKHIGTAMMKEINDWLQYNGADNALVGLITGETLAPFYHPFGFTSAFSMIKYLQPKPKQ